MMDRTKELLTHNLMRLRGIAGMTQYEASERVGVSVTTYQKYEYGKVFPSSETLTKIAEVFQVPVAELFESAEARGQHSSGPNLIASIVRLLSALNEDELGNVLSTIESSPSVLTGPGKVRPAR